MRMVYVPATSQVTVMDFWAAEFEFVTGFVSALMSPVPDEAIVT